MTGLSSRQWRLLWLSVAASAAGYLGFALWSGWHEVEAAVRHVGPGLILLSLLLSLFNYLLRAERWGLYLRQDLHPMPRLRNWHIYFAGFALTTTPGKAGEMIRSLFLKPWGVPLHHSAAMFFSERLADLVAILLLAFAGLHDTPSGAPLLWVLLPALLAGLMLLRTPWPERLLRRLAGGRETLFWLADVAASSRPFWRGGLLWRAQGLSCLAWLAEGVGAWCVMHALQPELGLSYGLFVYGFAMLAGALSFLPGGLGGTEATMTGLLVLKGMALPQAVAATVIIRLATLWFAVMLGLVALLSLPAVPADPRRD